MRYILILFTSIICTPINSLACDCITPSSDIKLNWGFADQVFIGKVVDTISARTHNYLGGTRYLATVEILESFKGYYHPKANMRTFGKASGNCSYDFELGKVYLIYANEIGGLVETTICTRTEPLERVEKWELNELKKLADEEEKMPYNIIIKSDTIDYRELELKNATATINELKIYNKWLIAGYFALSFLLLLLYFLSKEVKNTKYNIV